MAHVLIVDDEKSIRSTLSAYLRDDGHEVVEAEEVDAALQRLQAVAFDVVVTDIILPRVDGVELLRRIRRLSPTTQVVLMTGEPTVDTAREALRAGASDYLFKPINKAAILRVVATAVKIKALDDAKRRLEAENRAYQEDLERLVSERTEQLRVSEAQARELSRFNQAVLDAISASICVLAEDGTILAVNRAWQDSRAADLPLTGNADVGENYLEVCEAVTGDEAALTWSIVCGLRAVARGELPEFLLEYPCHSPVTQRWFLLRATRFVSEGLVRIATVHLNITERKRAEEALRESERMQATLIGNLPGFVYRCANDRSWTMEYISQGCREITGYAPEDFIGSRTLTFNDLVEPDWREPLWHKWQEVLSRQAPFEAEYPIRTAQGEVRWLWERGCGIFAADGRLLFLEGFVTDITERQQAEAERGRLQAQLSQAQKMESIGRLAGGVAHDSNNLLTGIMGYVELCRDSLAADHPVRAYLDEITQDAQRSAGVIRQLLAFARKQPIAPRVLDLNDAVTGMLGMLRRLLGEDIDLVWQPGAAVWTVKVDPSQLDQTLANLAVNARDAIGGVGRLTIETRNTTIDQASCAELADATPGDYVMLAVSDNGCGMSKEALKHLFEPFFTTKGVGEGTGLGLATVYGIARQNNGFIGVHSTLGRGTTFRIYLPRCDAVVAATPIVPAAACRGGTEMILLVEDEKSIRVTAQLFLEALGYTVLPAVDPEEALHLAATHVGQIALLITDVIMPGLSGRDLAQRLTRQQPTLRCLFMSGYTADAIAARGILDQGMHFLAKPFTRDCFARKVREVLEAPVGALPAVPGGRSR